MKKLIIISGATASGKTKTSLSLSKLLKDRAEIINFDSLIFYKELNIGTAKPTPSELSECPHHFINICSAKDPLNASDYVTLAFDKIQQLSFRNIIPILVGGSGFYLRALIKGMYETKSSDEKLRAEMDLKYKKEGITYFIDFLKLHDEKSLKQLHLNDHYRIIRAVEHFKMTGQSFSLQKNIMDSKRPYDFSTGRFEDFEILHIYLNIPKDEHWNIIEARAKEMVQSGLMDEVQDLLKSGFSKDNKALNSIGYKETLDFLDGQFKNKEEYIERISISTRQLAKSQKTFFKKITPKIIFNPITEFDKIIETVKQFAREERESCQVKK